jgi:hypothetical protein
MIEVENYGPAAVGIPLETISAGQMEAYAALPVAIWSDEHRGFWRIGGEGYTDQAAEAGRWTLAAAFFASRHCGPEKRIIFLPIDYIALDLPMPPSTNALFVEAPSRTRALRQGVDQPHGRSRVKTRGYKKWIEDTLLVLKPQLRRAGAPAAPETPIFGQHWAIWIRLNLDHGSDVTNRLKALEDLLVHWKVTVGDQWNDRCTIERDRSLGAVDCRVVIYKKVRA